MAEPLKTARAGDPLPAITEAAMRAAISCDVGCAPPTAAPYVAGGKRDLAVVSGL